MGERQLLEPVAVRAYAGELRSQHSPVLGRRAQLAFVAFHSAVVYRGAPTVRGQDIVWTITP